MVLIGSSARCLCCRVKLEPLELEVPNIGNNNPHVSDETVSPVFPSGSDSETTNSVNDDKSTSSSVALDFETFCRILGLRKPSRDYADLELNHKGSSSFCGKCSEVILSLSALRELLDKTKTSIEEKLAWISRTVVDAANHDTNTEFEVGSTSVKVGNNTTVIEEVEDPRFRFIQTELLQGPSVNYSSTRSPRQDVSTFELYPGGPEIKIESPGLVTEFDNFNTDDLDDPEFEIDYEDVQQIETSNRIEDPLMTPNLNEIEPDAHGSRSDNVGKDYSFGQTKTRKRGRARSSSRLSSKAKAKKTKVQVQEPRIVNSVDQAHCMSDKRERPIRQKKKSVRYLDYEDRTRFKSKLEQSYHRLMVKFGLDKLPELRIQLEDIYKVSKSVVSTTARRSLPRSSTSSNKPLFLSKEVTITNEPEILQPNSDCSDFNVKDNVESNSRSQSFKLRTAAIRIGKYKNVAKSKQRRLVEVKQRLNNNFNKIDDTEISSDEENEKQANDTDFEPLSDDDSNKSDRDSDFESNSGAYSDEDFEPTSRSGRMKRRKTNRIRSYKTQQKRNRLKNTIELKNGKKFYRSQEIIVEGNYWLCPYEKCSFKMTKDDSDTSSCQQMLSHLRSFHANDNYYCDPCQTFYKTVKEFETHNRKAHKAKRLRRQRLKVTIVSRKGKLYYRDQEIVQEGENWLCPYKTCDIKVSREITHDETFNAMRSHLKDAHSNDNYYCQFCEKFWRHKREFLRHYSRYHPGEEIKVQKQDKYSDSDLENNELNAKELGTEKSHQLKRSRKPKRLQMEIQVNGDKRFYRSQEIVEKDGHWLCPYTICNFKMLSSEDDNKSTSEMHEHLRTVHAADNHWCWKCESYFKTLGDLHKHDKREHPDPAIPFQKLVAKKGNLHCQPFIVRRRRLPCSIKILNGKRYYRSQEIVEEGGYWLCTFKNCDYKVLKSKEVHQSTRELLQHFRKFHASDNYWCQICQIYFKYLKQFYKHTRRTHKGVKMSDFMSMPRPKASIIRIDGDNNDRNEGELQDGCKTYGRIGRSRNRLRTSSIVIQNGKKYFRNLEIVEENDLLLCPFKNCDVKMPNNNNNEISCNDLLQHFNQCHSNDKFPCAVCGTIFDTSKKLRQHQQANHVETNFITCDVCGKEIRVTNATHKWTHLSNEERAEWTAAGMINPLAKIRTVCEDKLQCFTCGRTFSTNGNLREHELTHIELSKRTTYVCDKCGREFTTKNGLRNHEIIKHNPEQHFSKMKVCLICDRRFLMRAHLDIHMRRFHGAERFKCDKCDRHFPSKYDLKKHGITHMPDSRPFKCIFCEGTYRYPKNLERHIKKAHKDKNYIKPPPANRKVQTPPPPPLPVMTCLQMFPCEICDNKVFPMRSRLKKHMTLTHGHPYVYDYPISDLQHAKKLKKGIGKSVLSLKRKRHKRPSTSEESDEDNDEYKDMEESDDDMPENVHSTFAEQSEQVEMESAIESVVNVKENDDGTLMFLF